MTTSPGPYRSGPTIVPANPPVPSSKAARSYQDHVLDWSCPVCLASPRSPCRDLLFCMTFFHFERLELGRMDHLYAMGYDPEAPLVKGKLVPLSTHEIRYPETALTPATRPATAKRKSGALSAPWDPVMVSAAAKSAGSFVAALPPSSDGVSLLFAALGGALVGAVLAAGPRGEPTAVKKARTALQTLEEEEGDPETRARLNRARLSLVESVEPLAPRLAHVLPKKLSAPQLRAVWALVTAYGTETFRVPLLKGPRGWRATHREVEAGGLLVRVPGNVLKGLRTRSVLVDQGNGLWTVSLPWIRAVREQPGGYHG